jgi:hypothetical protein
VGLRDLLRKIDLKLRPLQLGEGQRLVDERDGIADADRAAATETVPKPWEDEGTPQ